MNVFLRVQKYPQVYFFMKNLILLSFFLLSLASTQAQSAKNDTIQTFYRRQPFLSFQNQDGIVLPTNDFIKSQAQPTFSAFSVKYGYAATKSRWQDYAYGMPYSGVGLMFAEFFNKEELGSPFALYAFQGTTISNLSARTKLNFEWFLLIS